MPKLLGKILRHYSGIGGRIPILVFDLDLHRALSGRCKVKIRERGGTSFFSVDMARCLYVVDAGIKNRCKGRLFRWRFATGSLAKNRPYTNRRTDEYELNRKQSKFEC
jgi:hypothetical protein